VQPNLAHWGYLTVAVAAAVYLLLKYLGLL
jgi:hypothetical protein